MATSTYYPNSGSVNEVGAAYGTWMSYAAWSMNPTNPSGGSVYAMYMPTSYDTYIQNYLVSQTASFYTYIAYVYLPVTGISKGDTITSANITWGWNGSYGASFTAKFKMWTANAGNSSSSSSGGSFPTTVNQFFGDMGWVFASPYSSGTSRTWDCTSQFQTMVDAYYFNPQKVLFTAHAPGVMNTPSGGSSTSVKLRGNLSSPTYFIVAYSAGSPPASSYKPKIIMS